MDRINITSSKADGIRPTACIYCSGTRVLLHIFLIYYGIKICYGLLMVIVASSGHADISCKIVGTSWRIYVSGFGWETVYNSFPIEWAYGVTSIDNPLLVNNVLIVLGLMIRELPLFFILLQMKKLLKQVQPGISPFNIMSVKAIRNTGIVFFYLAFVGEQTLELVVSQATAHLFSLNSMTAIVFLLTSFLIPDNLAYLFVGLLILVIAKIFQYGCQLQEDSDQII